MKIRRAQTEATFKQTDATVSLDQLRDAREALAFHAMLGAAMDRVLVEAAWARKTYPKSAVPAVNERGEKLGSMRLT